MMQENTTQENTKHAIVTSVLAAYRDGDVPRDVAEDLLRRSCAPSAERRLSPTPKETTTQHRHEAAAAYVWNIIVERGGVTVEREQGLDATFADLGVGSADLVHLVDRVETDLGITILPTVLFDHPTPRRTAYFLAEEFPEAELARGAADAPVDSTTLRSATAPPGDRSVQAPEAVDDIAIIGMAGRFPGADSVDELWAALRSRRDLLSPVPGDRWDHDALMAGVDGHGTEMSPRGGFVDRVDLFDAGRFSISPREAETIDPQVRLLLEVLHQTADDAGMSARLRGSRTGTFVGTSFRDYDELMMASDRPIGPHDATGNAAAMAANRPAYVFDLRGPSATVDTACSSSLVAVHQAVQALHSGECDMAFAAGTNLVLAPRHYQHLAALGALSARGRCDAFGPGADGYVPAEAVAAVLLKPLQAAIADGDPVHAVIKGSAMLHAGHTASLTAPAPQSQADLLLRAWEDAGIHASSLGFIEAHGTGTSLGDPVEIEGILAAFAAHDIPATATMPDGKRCVVSSAKAHLGHAEASAGIVGLIKAALTLEHGELTAMPGFESANPYCRVQDGPLRIDQESTVLLRRAGQPRRGAVSSFGFGGTGAHAVLEEAPEREEVPAAAGPWPIPLSAEDDEGISAWAASIVERLQRLRTFSVEGVAAQMSLTHRPQASRAIVLAEDATDLIRGLEALAAGQRPALRTASPGLRSHCEDWLLGEDVDWGSWWGTRRPVRVPLPGRPMRPDPYWFEPRTPELPASGERPSPPSAVACRADAQTVHHMPQLVPEPHTRDFPTPERALVVAVGSAAEPAARALSSAWPASRCIVVADEPGGRDLGDADLADLAREARRAAVPDCLVWITTPPSGDLRPGPTDQVVSASLDALSTFVASWRTAAPEADRTLKVITVRHGTDPAQAALAGLAHSVVAWDRRLSWGCLQVDTAAPAAMLPDAVAAELAALRPGQVVDVVRDDRGRRILEMAPVSAPGRPHAFRKGGRYVLTGGAGAIGRALGEHLARHYAAKLVLMGRSVLCPDINDHLAHLEQFGAEAAYVQADVTSMMETNATLAFAHARFGGIDGVIHLAGSLVESPVDQRSVHQMGAMRAPKVAGTLVLDEVTKDEPIELFVALSSMSTVVGTPLLADYSTANRFVDAFMERRRMQVLDGLRHGASVALDLPYWRHGGLTMPESTSRQIENLTGMKALEANEGVRLIDEALTVGLREDVGRVVSALGSPEHIAATVQAGPRLDEPATSRAESADRTPPPSPRPGGAAGPPGRPGADEDILALVVAGLGVRAATVLKLQKPPAPEEDLATYGFESITVHEFVRDLNAWLGIELDIATFFEHRSVDSLARYLVQAFPTQINDSVAGKGPGSRGAKDPGDGFDADEPMEPASIDHHRPETPEGEPVEDGIAIVGMAGRLPGADSLEEYWRGLVSGRDAVREYPYDRLPWPEDYGPRPQGGFLGSIADFDPDFFRVTRREAEVMDPQQRLLLTCAHEALVDAAVPYDSLSATRTGVFVGVSNVDHVDVLRAAGLDGDAHSVTGLAHGMLANRLSYHLNLKGPSEAMDTACSSSLVAVNRAVASLRAGECDTAIVAGVNILSSPGPFRSCASAGMLSASGHCHTFGADADGYVRGEGVVVVALRLLSDATGAGDPVRAVLRGTGVSHNGHAHGLTVPDPLSQASLIESVHRRADVDPRTVGMVEAHGTGTPVGDPLEINGLLRAFSQLGAESGPAWCGVGSVKSGIGHLESASGLAGLAKVVLSMEHSIKPPTLHADPVNPQVRLDGTPLFLLREAVPWPRENVAPGTARARRAAVSAFGFGGVNAHVVVEEAPDRHPPITSSEGPCALVLSARSTERLRRDAARLADHLDAHPIRLCDVEATLAEGRTHESTRRAILADTPAAAIVGLRELARTDGQPDLEGPAEIVTPVRAWLDGGPIAPAVSSVGRRISLPSDLFELERCWPEGSHDNAPATQAPVAPMRETPVPHPELHVRTREALRSLFASHLRLPLERVDTAREFDHLNLESVGLLEIVRLLEGSFGSLPQTLLYQCRTVDSLAEYLSRTRPAETDAWIAGAPLASTETDGGATTTTAELEGTTRQPGHTRAAPDEPIAIVGMSGIFPGAPDIDALWQKLMDGADLVGSRRTPMNRGMEASDGGDGVRRAGFIEDVDAFDARFFGISPLEAELMDPQQRIFLQVSVGAVEHAGYSLTSLRGSRTGIFVGVSAFDYYGLVTQAGRHREAHAPTGSSHAVLANRVSFLLDLHGPSEPVDTACSSALSALHRGVRSLQAGDCDVALVGGVNLLLTDDLFDAFDDGGFLSPTARCQAFGAGADGYVRGEGAAAVVLKPLSTAERDGDTVHAVIRGSGVNHGGRVQSLTVPNPTAQSELISGVHARAGISAPTVTYVEAHGTGTPLGDPIELAALTEAFAEADADGERPREAAWCGLGSIKSNMGHLEAAAGMAGLVKVVQGMRYGALPASLHLESPNPLLDLEGGPFTLMAQASPWDRIIGENGAEVNRRAGISSFGFGGSNGHVLLEEYRPVQGTTAGDADERGRAGRAALSRDELLVLSAASREQLRRYAQALQQELTGHDDRAPEQGVRLVDIAYTLQVGRDAHPHRVALRAAGRADAITYLGAYLRGDTAGMPVWAGHADSNATLLGALGHDLDNWARAWVSGATVPWEVLHRDGARQRVPLPTYPFARSRYWVDTGQASVTDPLVELLEGLSAGATSVDDVEQLLSDSWEARR